jgi:hypothetical protein
MKRILFFLCIFLPILSSCTSNAEHQKKEQLLIGHWKEDKYACRLYNEMVFQENGQAKFLVGRHQWLEGSYQHLNGVLYDIVAPKGRHHEITIQVQGNQMKMSAAYVDSFCLMKRVT